MALDIRGNVFCSAGPVIRGGFSDDHIQGTGLIKTKGEIVLNGLIKLTPGQSISLGYEKQGRVNRIPRALRVLSSFADPFRRETTVSVGCKLTMLENFRESRKTDLAEVVDYLEVDCKTVNDIPLNMPLNHIVSQCLASLGLSGGVGISGSVAIDSFDFAAGYVNILSDLLYSNSLIGYLNENESFVVRTLYGSGTSPVLDEDDIIDVSPIRSGEIPASTVIVNYNYSRFTPPKQEEEEKEAEDDSYRQKRDWELEETQGELQYVIIKYNGSNSQHVFSYYPFSSTKSTYDVLDRKLTEVKTEKIIAAQLNSQYVTEMLDETGGYGNGAELVEHRSQTRYGYQYKASELVPPIEEDENRNPCFANTNKGLVRRNPDGSTTTYSSLTKFYTPERDDQPIFTESITFESEMAIMGAINLPSYVYKYFNENLAAVTELLHPGTQLAETSIVINNLDVRDSFGNPKNDPDEGVTYQETTYIESAFKRIQFQQGLAKMAEDVGTAAQAYNVFAAAAQLVNHGSGTKTVYSREFGPLLKRPSAQKRAKERYAKDPRESFSDLEFIAGGAGNAITTSYDLPIAPDDEIKLNLQYQGIGTGDTHYLVSESRAPELAREFGRTQQRLTYGHRMGFSVQTVPDKLPPYPAMGISLRLGGIIATYIANAQSWSFDSNGIVASADFLYLGGVGATTSAYVTPSPWAPVQDGITALPIAPAVVTNPNPTAANSATTPTGFDASNPGNIFTTLPSDTAPVHAKQITVDAVIPPYQEVAIHTLYVRTSLTVTRTLIRLPIPDRDVLVRTRAAATADQFQYPTRLTELRVRASALVEQTYYAVRDVLLRTRIYYAVERTELFDFAVGNALPLLGSGLTTGTPTGWVQAYSGNVDDTPLEVALPFAFPFNGVSYNSFWLSPNGYITFGSGSSLYPGTATSPALPKILINSADDSMQKVLTRSTANTFRVRVDGNIASGGGDASFARTFEVAFFRPSFTDGYPVIEVRIGASPSVSGLLNVYSATTVLSTDPAPTPAPNSSWVFLSDTTTGTEWFIAAALSCTPVE